MIFAEPRQARSGRVGLWLVRRSGAGWSCLAEDPEGGAAVAAGALERGWAGRRWVEPLPVEPSPLSALLDWEGWSVGRLEAVGEIVPEAPLLPEGALLGLRGRLGLAAGGPEVDDAAGEGDAQRARLGELLAALGGALLGALLRWRSPTFARPTLGRSAERVPARVGPRLPAWLSAALSALAALSGSILALLLSPIALFGTALATLWPGRWWPSGGWPATLLTLLSLLRGLGVGPVAALALLMRRVEGSALLLALQRAVPLGGPAGAPPKGWVFGRRPRDSARRAAELGLLARVYLDTHRRLDQQGEVHRAAWVLAHLLERPEEAVDYLARRAGPGEAAPLAELLGRPGPELVRRWSEAGDPERALRLGLLRGTLTELPPAVALGWAAHRMELGDGVGALAVAWPHRALSPGLLLGWSEALAASEGPASAHGYCCALLLDPEGPLAAEAERSARLKGGPVARRSLAEAAVVRQPLPMPLVEPLLRALLVDLGGGDLLARPALQGLLAAAPPAAFDLLRQDLPPLRPEPGAALFHPAAQRRPLVRGAPIAGADAWVAPPVMGPLGVLDAAWTAGDGLFEALGHSLRVRRPGAGPRLIVVPADKLLTGSGFSLLLGPAGRGGGVAVSTFGADGCLRPRGALPWATLGEGPVGLILAEGLWLAAAPDGLMLLVPEGDRLRSLWRSGPLHVGGAPASVRALEARGALVRALLVDGRGRQSRWTWDRAAGLRVLERLRLEPALPHSLAGLDGDVVWESAPSGERVSHSGLVERLPARPGRLLLRRGDRQHRWASDEHALLVSDRKKTHRLRFPGVSEPPRLREAPDGAVLLLDAFGRSFRLLPERGAAELLSGDGTV